MRAARQTSVVLGAALLAAAVASAWPAAASPRIRPQARPVPSLEPSATQRQWRRLVRARHPFAADCAPLRTVFYASTDWLRLATRLAASVSPCADYYVSIPPLTSDKTQPRGDQAWRIRALGPRFHALADVQMAAWSSWAAANGWYNAGAEARRRMAVAGYDTALGDTWVVNELSSAVRRGDGTARADAREFVRGLYDGGPLPDVRGGVFITGIGQGTLDLSVYQTRLQSWLEDASFWQDMAAYVTDFSQEVYGDVRNYAVPGTVLPDRRGALDAYLQHELALVRAGPESTAAARTFLETSYSPLANAAWQWDSAYGWTFVDAEMMKDYVSAQVYALRSSPRDRFGFAWAPRNGSGLAAGDFAAQTGAVLDRLAAAIKDSGEPVDEADPGIGACRPAWCGAEIAGGWFNDGWKAFAVWTAAAPPPTEPPLPLPEIPAPTAFVEPAMPVPSIGPIAPPAAPRGSSARKGLTRRGTARRDVLVGTRFADRLYGRGGNDVLRGRGGRDLLVAGPGADTVYARDGARDVVDCGSGRDRVFADRIDRVKPNCRR